MFLRQVWTYPCYLLLKKHFSFNLSPSQLRPNDKGSTHNGLVVIESIWGRRFQSKFWTSQNLLSRRKYCQTGENISSFFLLNKWCDTLASAEFIQSISAESSLLLEFFYGNSINCHFDRFTILLILVAWGQLVRLGGVSRDLAKRPVREHEDQSPSLSILSCLPAQPKIRKSCKSN